jgi:hypothetical protein
MISEYQNAMPFIKVPSLHLLVFFKPKKCLSGSSSLNLQQLEQQEEDEELNLLDRAHVRTRPTFLECSVRRRKESGEEMKMGLKLLPVTES